MQRFGHSEPRWGAVAEASIDAFERAQRSFMGITPVYFLAVLCMGATFHPTLGGSLGVEPTTARVALTAFLFIVTVTNFAYHWRGWRSWLYLTLDRVETLVVHSMLQVFIYASRGVPLYWILFLVFVMASSTQPRTNRFTLTLVPLGSLATALSLLLVAGDLEASLMTLLFGAAATFLAFLVSGQRERLTQALEEREELRAALGAVRVAEERGRIARDLHDGVAGDLSALTARLDALRVTSEAGDTQSLGADLAVLHERAARGIDDLRSIVWALQAPEGSLQQTLAYARTRCAELCPSDVHFELSAGDEDVSLDGALRLHVLRVLQEGVRNSLRHGRAGRVVVRAHVRGPVLQLVVEDDGVGMSERSKRDGGGLLNLERRARERGGSLTLCAGASGRGTKLVVEFGLPREEAEHAGDGPLRALPVGRELVRGNLAMESRK